jgi:protein-S-isoprenylcysteine O-methyltransferase Ste14
LFRHRTWLPLPLALALFLVRAGEAPSSMALVGLGTGLVVSAELVRLWAVRHIGVVSRTRSDRLGPLVRTGPFAFVRNPLYLGNILLWVGFALTARLLWLVPVFIAVLGLAYHAIVQWEEQMLESSCGDEFRAYASEVPRWIPVLRPRRPSPMRPPHSWRETWFSERGTLAAIGVGYLLLWIKSQV